MRRFLPYLLIAGLSILAYVNTLGHALVHDDSQITSSPLLHDPWNLRAIWNGGFYGESQAYALLYRPLADWGDLVNFRLNEIVFGSGTSPFGFHAACILIHAAVGCLMFAWLRCLNLATPICLIAALLFGVHPLHTESVANITNRSDAQAALFGLSFLILHARRVPIAPAALYLCAMWSKESAAAFFPLAIAVDALMPGSGDARSAARETADARPRRRWPLADYAVLTVTLVLWFWLRESALAGIPKPFGFQENPLEVASVGDRILTAGAVQLRYLQLLILPIGLSSDYSYDQIPTVASWSDPSVLGFFAVLIAALALGWRLRHSVPAVPLAILGYAILFSTTSNFVLPIGTIMGERLAYMPSILFCLLVGIGSWELRKLAGERTVVAAVGLLCAGFLWLTIQRNKTWSDNLTFYREQVRTSPRSAKAHLNLGSTLAGMGDDRGAIEEYERSIAIVPFYTRTHYLLGNALRRSRADPEKVVHAYREAIRVGPSQLDARVNLAWTLIDLGRVEEARVIVNELAALDPKHTSLAALTKGLAARGAGGSPPAK